MFFCICSLQIWFSITLSCKSSKLSLFVSFDIKISSIQLSELGVAVGNEKDNLILLMIGKIKVKVIYLIVFYVYILSK